MANLPSIIRSQNFLNLHYQHVLEFDDKVPKKGFLRDMNVERKIKILSLIKGKSFVLARHCCSILHTVGQDGLWLGLMLVDHPINNAYKYRHPSNEKAETILVQTRPFHDGDDYGPPSFLEMVPNLSPMQTTLSETMTAHWTQRLPQDYDLTYPSLFALAYCPLRIVAMEWMTCSELMYHSIKHYEYSTETIPAALERIEVLSADLSALQQWIRRGMATLEKIRQVTHFLRSLGTSGKDVDQGTLLLEDDEQLACTIETYSRRLEAMVAIAASVIQAIDCRRSLTETANISRLTYLALGSIPLTFASGLFSMNEKIAPGGKMFWLYFAVAIPLCFRHILWYQYSV